jgi:hypothetical protein
MILPERTLRHRSWIQSPQIIAVTLVPCTATENSHFLPSRNGRLRSLGQSHHPWYALFSPRPVAPRQISDKFRELLIQNGSSLSYLNALETMLPRFLVCIAREDLTSTFAPSIQRSYSPSYSGSRDLSGFWNLGSRSMTCFSPQI